MGDLRSKIWKYLRTERVDLVNLRTASPVSHFEIVRSGASIYKEMTERNIK